MKGTTLTELNQAYENQAISRVSKTHSVESWKYTDVFFFDIRHEKRKLAPLGRAFIRLLTICKEDKLYD